jgi:hypothetical protein
MITLDSLSKGQQTRAPRMVILGVEKIGKTSFACGCHFDDTGALAATGLNSPVVIPCRGEEGTDSLDVTTFPTAQTADEVLESIGALYDNEHDFRTVVVDSASALEPLVWQATCRAHNVKNIEEVGGGYGKGYIQALSQWSDILAGLDALRNEKNMASIFIGHVKVKRFDDPGGDSYDTYAFDINEKAANLIFRWADVILFANTKVQIRKEDLGFKKEKKRGIDTSGGQRFVFTQKRPAHPGGGRGVYGRLPYELPLDWKTFEETLATVQ